MAVIEVDSNKTFYIDNQLKENLDILLDGLKQNDDFVIVIDGPEGAGKSKLAQQIGFYCAKRLGTPFGVDNIHFQLNDYIDFSIEKPEYTVLILDEARKILNRKSATSNEVKKFTNYLSECRSNKQVHIICLPAYHDLDKYVALWRMKCVIHLKKYFVESSKFESGYEIRRGEYFAYFNVKNLQYWYDKPYNYPNQYELTGKFKNVDVIDEKEYQEKKGLNLLEKYHSSKEKEKENHLMVQYRRFIYLLCSRLRTDYGYTISDLARFGGWNEKKLRSMLTYIKHNYFEANTEAK